MRKLFKHIGMICLAFAIAVGSFFVPLKSDNNLKSVHADSVETNYTYIGKELFYLDMFVLTHGSQSPVTKPVSFSVNLTSNSLADLSVISTSYFINSDNRFETPTYLEFFPWNDDYFPYSMTNLPLVFNSVERYRLSTPDIYVNGTHLPFYVKVEGDFNCNVSRFSIATYDYTHSLEYELPSDVDRWYYFLNSNYNVINITYYDVNDNSITFQFYTLSSINLTPRTYYIISSNNLSDNQLYNQGFQDGLADNQQNIYDNGYDDGYDIGLNRGKIIGASEANDYSFISLFGAIFDAPITMLTSLLNFEFLGINLWAFVTSLFTLALVLFVIKLVMGR